MSASLSSVPKLQFFDANGNPLVGGKLYTYAAGTTTPLATYTDSSAGTPNTNPIILNSRGEANVWLANTTYKFVLKTSADVEIWTVDNISNAINTSQILASGGSAANPPYTFSTDSDTGMYLAAVGQLGLTVNGTPVLRSTPTIMTIGQSGGSNDVDVTLYGDLTQTGNVALTGNITQTGNIGLTGNITQTGDIGLTGNITQSGNIGLTGNLTQTGDTAQTGKLSVAGNARTAPVAVTFDATTMTVNCALSNVFTTTFTANVTVAPTLSNPGDGQTINWFITQDATGGRTMTWPTSFKWPSGATQTLSTTANAVDLLVATYRSATGFWYAGLQKGFA